MIPDWQLPPGVDRGLWNYLHADEMVAGYDEQMRTSHLARVDLAFCEHAFPTPGRLLDLGCGTGRLCAHFAAKGFDCVGVDLSEEMLAKARARTEAPSPTPPSVLSGPVSRASHGPEPGEGLPTESTALAPPSFPGKGIGGFGSEEPTPNPSLKGGEQDNSPPFRGGVGVGSSTFLKANLVDLTELADQSFDFAACLFSTLGMVRGAENRRKVLANAFRLLKPGGRFVLHVHNRFFGGLGWKRVAGQRLRTLLGRTSAGEITMPQAYGGAPLTLHHFTHSEAVGGLEAVGFTLRESQAVGLDGNETRGSRVYGWLLLAERPLTPAAPA